MSTGRNTAAMSKVNARGENVIVVTKRVTPNPDGSTTVEAQIKLDNAPVPERRYAADVVHIAFDGDAVFLMFGQRAIGGGKLRSLVAIKLFPENVRRFLKTCEQFAPQLDALLARNKINKPAILPLSEEPPHVVSLVANVLAAGYSQREAVLDFYHFNALALRKLNEGSELAIDAVVRVDLPTTWLASLIEALNKMKDELPPEIE